MQLCGTSLNGRSLDPAISHCAFRLRTAQQDLFAAVFLDFPIAQGSVAPGRTGVPQAFKSRPLPQLHADNVSKIGS